MNDVRYEDRWAEIQRLFLSAADLCPADQSKFLYEHCGTDGDLRAEVEALLSADREAETDLATPVALEAAHLLDSESLIGSRLGPYRVIEEIGRGGMGAVYLAQRDDDLYSRSVAIKVVKRGMDTAEILARFRRERQILANLDHPYIARLLDGGVTPGGRPFFVMERIEGQALDEFVKRPDLNVRQRCDLFLRVCEAVAYAHRNLVLHLDLKPANILVAPDGTPKLLDFGVAKLLSPVPGQLETATVTLRPVTPDYAAPEQIRGLPVSTATDIYELGAIFYELLSGRRAHQFHKPGTAEIERVVCETDPPRLSDTASKIPTLYRADLAAIAAKAMRKEAVLRYSSVEQLAADIEHCFNGEPVLARQGAVAYRTRKILRRHWVTLTAAALFITTVTGAAVVAVVQRQNAVISQARAEASRRDAVAQAREADRQRNIAESQRAQTELQRIAADTQRELAEHRFAQVRQLAGRFVVEFHDSIATLSGATAARKKILETGLQYYDTLLDGAHGDEALLKEIARGYDRLAGLNGEVNRANLGDLPTARESILKAIAIRNRIHDGSLPSQRDLLSSRILFIGIENAAGKYVEAREEAGRVIRDAETSSFASSAQIRVMAARAYSLKGDAFSGTGDNAGALENYVSALASLQVLAQQDPSLLLDLARAHSRVASICTWLRRDREAVEHGRLAVRIYSAESSKKPADQDRLNSVAGAYGVLCAALKNNPQLAQPGEYEKAVSSSVEVARRMAAADPGNHSGGLNLYYVLGEEGDFRRSQNDLPGALEAYTQAEEEISKYIGHSPLTVSTASSLSFIHQRLASVHARRGDLQATLDEVARGEAVLAESERLSPGNPRVAMRLSDLLQNRADAYAGKKMWKQAIADNEEARQVIMRVRTRAAPWESYLTDYAMVLRSLAVCYAADGQRLEAIRNGESSLEVFGQIAAARALSDEEQQARNDLTSKLPEWRARL